MAWRYLIALGSNRRHHRHGRPQAVLAAALAALAGEGVMVERASPIVQTPPLGPSLRRYANAAAIVHTELAPPDLLVRLKAIERAFGRRQGGRRWCARVLDLDIVLWQGGIWTTPGLAIPHPAYRQRAFVLAPAMHIAPHWRDPVTGLTLRHLSARLTRSQGLPIAHSRWGP